MADFETFVPRVHCGDSVTMLKPTGKNSVHQREGNERDPGFFKFRDGYQGFSPFPHQIPITHLAEPRLLVPSIVR